MTNNTESRAFEEIEFGEFFTCREYFLKRYDALGRQMGFSANNAAEYYPWARELKALLRQITGVDTMIPAALQPKITETVDCGDFVRERIQIQTEPDVIMPLYAFTPKEIDWPAPALIAPHGHSSGGKLAIAGRNDIPQLADTIHQHNYDYGVQLVKKGFVVFCPDARGFGERREWMHQNIEQDFPHGSCRELNNMAIPLGQTLTGMWAWDLMRLIDYIVEFRDECDGRRIGSAGLSGGGLQTLWLAALDERVQCAVISGYYYGYRDSLLKLNGNCSCNYVPNLWKLVDMGDIGALIAPRPLFIETGDKDSLNGERGVVNTEEQVQITRGAYEIFGAGDRLVHHVFHGEHMWDGSKSIPWLSKNLR